MITYPQQSLEAVVCNLHVLDRIQDGNTIGKALLNFIQRLTHAVLLLSRFQLVW